MMPHACKFPLGRQQHTKHKQFTTELIKPVSEMLEYLSFEADLKNIINLLTYSQKHVWYLEMKTFSSNVCMAPKLTATQNQKATRLTTSKNK